MSLQHASKQGIFSMTAVALVMLLYLSGAPPSHHGVVGLGGAATVGEARVPADAPATRSAQCVLEQLGEESDTKCETWVSANPEGDGQDVAISPIDGSIYIAGRSFQPGQVGRFFVQALEPATGEELWQTVSSQGGANIEVALNADGTLVFVAGQSESGSDSQWTVSAFDARVGDELWATSYKPDGGVDLAAGLALTPDGNRLYLSGEGALRRKGFSPRGMIAALDASTGKRLWVKMLWSADTAYAVVASARDRVYVAGPAQRGDGGVLAAYKASTGRRLWVRSWDSRSSRIGVTPSSLVSSPDGRRLFVGATSRWLEPDREETDPPSDSVPKYWLQLRGLNATTGKTLWTTPLEAFPLSGLSGLEIHPDGSYVFASAYQDVSSTGSRDAIAVAYDAKTGYEIWAARNQLPDPHVQPVDLEASPDGKAVYIAAHSYFSDEGDDFLTFAINPADGKTSWFARFNTSPQGTDRNRAFALAAALTGGGLYVTGSNESGPNPTAVTLAYSA